MEYRKISVLKDKVEEMESPVKKHLNLKIFSNKLPGSWNIMRRWKLCIAGIEEEEEPQENVLNKIIKKYPPKDVYQSTGRIQNIK